MGESNTTTVEELPGPVRVSDLALFLGSPAAGDITGQIWSLEHGGV
jgi:hypothetical protein